MPTRRRSILSSLFVPFDEFNDCRIDFSAVPGHEMASRFEDLRLEIRVAVERSFHLAWCRQATTPTSTSQIEEDRFRMSRGLQGQLSECEKCLRQVPCSSDTPLSYSSRHSSSPQRVSRIPVGRSLIPKQSLSPVSLREFPGRRAEAILVYGYPPFAPFVYAYTS